MYNFDKEAYFTDAKLTYDTRGEIERVADEVSKQGFKNIFFISSGGSLAVMQPIPDHRRHVRLCLLQTPNG